MTPFTSLVAVEETISRADGKVRRVLVPVALSSGLTDSAVGLAADPISMWRSSGWPERLFVFAVFLSAAAAFGFVAYRVVRRLRCRRLAA